jgi:hypothetical protein
MCPSDQAPRRGSHRPGHGNEGIASMQPQSTSDRFWSKVRKTDACWLWKPSKSLSDYGQFNAEGKSWRAHRYSYEQIKGPIPAGLVLDHLCRTPACVNPDHLEAVTDRVNCHRGLGPPGVNSRKTECDRGHALSGDNLILESDGHRRCRECKRLREKRRLRTRSQPGAAQFPYVWVWERLNRKGQPCRVICRGSMNLCLLEFDDGFRVVTDRHGTRHRKLALGEGEGGR